MTYDSSNVFAKILRQEIPCHKVYEDEFVLAFHDIQPKAPIHVLVIPKGSYVSSTDFYKHATADEILGYAKGISKTLETLGLEQGEGYRLLSNSGPHSGQEVPHFHTHIFAGRPLGPMIGVSHAA